MNRLGAWVHEKPWHMYLMLALTAGLLLVAVKQLRKSGGGGPFVGQTSAGMVDNAQYDELRNELAALQSYVQNGGTPNAPSSGGDTINGSPIVAGGSLGTAPDPKGTAGESDNFWIPGSDPGHPGSSAPTQGQTFRQWIASLWNAGWLKPSGTIQNSDQAAAFFANYRNNGAILSTTGTAEGYKGNPLDTPLQSGQQFSI